MAGLCWVAVMLAFLLSAKNSLAAVDQKRLAQFVDGILREYQPAEDMFSLAVSIPENQNLKPDQILQEVFTSDPGDNVKNIMNDKKVYSGIRVVAAKVVKRDYTSNSHAESLVLALLPNLLNKIDFKNDMLLFYVYASPCKECSSRDHNMSILRKLNDIRKRHSYAVVFSKVFRLPPPTSSPNAKRLPADVNERRQALQNLGTFRGNQRPIGMENIFRCDRQTDNSMQCTSCYNLTLMIITPYCVDDNSSIQPQQSNRNANSGQSGSGIGGGARGAGSTSTGRVAWGGRG